MSFIIDVDKIQYTPGAYGGSNTQCAALVQQGPMLNGGPHPPQQSLWRKGQHIKTSPQLPRGTVIATFTPAGLYPSASEGNRHTAVYLYHDNKGIRVIDQWHPDKPTPGQRTLYFTTDQFWFDAPRVVNKGDHYYVVEVEPDF